MTFCGAHQTNLYNAYMQPSVTSSYVDDVTVTRDIIELPSNSRRDVARPKSAWRGRGRESHKLPAELGNPLKINLEAFARNADSDDDNRTTRLDQSVKRKHSGSSSTSDDLPAYSSSSSPFIDRKPEAANSMSQILTARQRVLERYEHKRHLEVASDDMSTFLRERSIVMGGANKAAINGHRALRYGRHRVLDPIIRTAANDAADAATSVDSSQNGRWQ